MHLSPFDEVALELKTLQEADVNFRKLHEKEFREFHAYLGDKYHRRKLSYELADQMRREYQAFFQSLRDSSRSFQDILKTMELEDTYSTDLIYLHPSRCLQRVSPVYVNTAAPVESCEGQGAVKVEHAMPDPHEPPF